MFYNSTFHVTLYSLTISVILVAILNLIYCDRFRDNSAASTTQLQTELSIRSDVYNKIFSPRKSIFINNKFVYLHRYMHKPQ